MLPDSPHNKMNMRLWTLTAKDRAFLMILWLGLNCVPHPPNFYIEARTPNVTVFGKREFKFSEIIRVVP